MLYRRITRLVKSDAGAVMEEIEIRSRPSNWRVSVENLTWNRNLVYLPNAWKLMTLQPCLRLVQELKHFMMQAFHW